MCIFCDIVNKKVEANIVYEDEIIIAFLDNAPINEGHILVIPKKHYLDIDELPNELLIEIMKVSQMMVRAMKKVYKPNGYSIMQNGGEFNDIGHFHIHIFPRYLNDGFSWQYSDESFRCSKEIAEKLAKAMRE